METNTTVQGFEIKDLVEQKKYADLVVEPSQTYDIKDVPIFKVGKWNGDNYTEKDLDDMVNAFDETKSTLKPFVKLGHDKEQKLLQKDGYPAAGWITGLKRKGKDLLADFSSMPSKIKTLIEKKAYGRFSSEIYWNVNIDNKKYRRALKAVALLGGNTPAVTTMDDFINLYIDTNVDYDELKDYHNLEESKMDEKLFDSIQADNKNYIKELNDKDFEIKSYVEKISDLENEVEKLHTKIETTEAEKKDAEIKSYIDSQVKEGKILPSQVEMYSKLAQSDIDSVKEIVENNPKLVDLETKSQHEETPKVKDYSAMSEEEKDELLNDKAMEFVKSNPDVKFVEALEIVNEMMEAK
ncbi:MAG: hypothetical protein GY853_02060 [PVC group bacterium]|nr:hypothetical protein [PVC group bacterium]